MPRIVPATTTAHTASLATSARSSVLARRSVTATAAAPAVASKRPQLHAYAVLRATWAGRKLQPPTHGHPGKKSEPITGLHAMVVNDVTSAAPAEPRAASSTESCVIRSAP